MHGDNHFVVCGPLPNRATALALAKEWSSIQIGHKTPEHLIQWKICSRAFREDLNWAVIVPTEEKPSAAVALLLTELAGRGIELHDTQRDNW